MSERLIEFFPSDTLVCVHVKLPGVDTFEFTFEADSAWAAKLLCRAINAALHDRQSSLFQEAYERGWKDAKAKRAKLQGCYGFLP